MFMQAAAAAAAAIGIEMPLRAEDAALWAKF